MNTRIIFILLALTVSCSTINGGAAANIHDELALTNLLEEYPLDQYGNGVRLMHRLHNLIRKLSYKANSEQRPPFTDSEKEVAATSNDNENEDRNSNDDHHDRETAHAALSHHDKREDKHVRANSEIVDKKHDEPGMFPFKKSDDGNSDSQRWYPFKKADVEQRWYPFKRGEDGGQYWYPFKRESSNDRRAPGFPFKRGDGEQRWYPFKRANADNKRHSEMKRDPWGYPFKRASVNTN